MLSSSDNSRSLSSSASHVGVGEQLLLAALPSVRLSSSESGFCLLPSSESGFCLHVRLLLAALPTVLLSSSEIGLRLHEGLAIDDEESDFFFRRALEDLGDVRRTPFSLGNSEYRKLRQKQRPDLETNLTF